MSKFLSVTVYESTAKSKGGFFSRLAGCKFLPDKSSGKCLCVSSEPREVEGERVAK